MVIIGVFLIRKLKAEKQGYFTKVGRENNRFTIFFSNMTFHETHSYAVLPNCGAIATI